jgi:hypothetical protein
MEVKVSTVVAIIVLILWIVSIPIALDMNWKVEQDTTAWLDRAQVASNPTDMQTYLLKVKDGMEKHGLTEGNAAIIYPTAETDMPLIMEALQQSIDRTEYMKGFNVTSVQYQVALDDVRGQIRELYLHAEERFWKENLAFMLWVYLGWLVFGTIMFLGLILED